MLKKHTRKRWSAVHPAHFLHKKGYRQGSAYEVKMALKIQPQSISNDHEMTAIAEALAFPLPGDRTRRVVAGALRSR